MPPTRGTWNLHGFTCSPVTGCMLAIALLGSIIPSSSEEQNITKSQAQKVEVNILFFYEETESMRSFDAAIDYIKVDPKLEIKIGQVYKINSSGSDGTRLMMQLCMNIDKAFATANKPDIVVDFTRQGLPSEMVKMVVKVMNLPTVSASFGQEGDIRAWRDITDKMKRYLIQIAPPADVVPQAVRSLVSLQDMSNAVLLFAQEFEMNHKYNSLLANLPTRHLVTKLETSPPHFRRQIARLVHYDITNFFIAASPNQISEVLAEASSPEMPDGPYFSDEFAWYSMSMERDLPKCHGCQTNVSLIHLRPKLSGEANRRREFIRATGVFKGKPKLMDTFYFDLTVNAILAVKKLKKSGAWTPPPQRVCRETAEIIDDYNLDLFSALKEFSNDNMIGPFHLDPDAGVGKSFASFEMEIIRLVFKQGHADPETLENLGVWKAGFSERDLITMSDGREDQWRAHLALTVLRVVTVVQPPFVYKRNGCKESAENKYSRCFVGYCIDMLERIQEELQFNYTIRNVSGYGYMAQEPPHQWSGMVRELKDRKADIALGAMSVMAEREGVVDFTVPFYDLVGISILMKKPKTYTSLFKFLTVLENDVWLTILGAYLFTSFLMWVFDRWSPYSYQNNREKYEVDDEEPREFNIKECLWFCMTSLTPQGGGEAPQNLSGRLVAATWWLFCFIIIASYTANLAAFLTVTRLDAPIESVEDLAKQYKIQWAPQQHSSAWVHFDRMAHIEHRFHQIWKDLSLNDSTSHYEQSHLAVWDYPVRDKFTKMWQAIQENNPPKTFEEAIKRVRGEDMNQQDGFAFLDEATNIRYQTMISCDLKQVGEEFSRKPYAIAVQKGSPLRESFSHLISKLLNQRHLEQLKESWWNDNAMRVVCPKDDNLSDGGISIHNIGGVFFVIIAGIVMACFTLVFEFWGYRKRKRAVERAEMDVPPKPKEFGRTSSTQKTNFSSE